MAVATAALARKARGAVVSVLNRSAVVKADGTWRINNVPANFAPVRIRANSVIKDGVTRSAQSDFVRIEAYAFNGFGEFSFGSPAPILAKLQLRSASLKLTSSEAAAQAPTGAILRECCSAPRARKRARRAAGISRACSREMLRRRRG